MNRKTDVAARPKAADRRAGQAGDRQAAAERPPAKDGVRETVESIVIAFVLAFLFRTFEAEAFVIPTGSMAPTLMGQHKDLVCSECGYPYRVSASEAADDAADKSRAELKAVERDLARLEARMRPGLSERDEDRLRQDLARLARGRDRIKSELANKDVVACTCPMCRYTMRIDPKRPEGKDYPSFKGDRILVAKFPYEFRDPHRWDVAVFKYPETAKQNFIKRIVGLPNETVIIHRGDILTAQPSVWRNPSHAELLNQLRAEGKVHIQRKPPAKIEALLQAVYDNDYVLPKLIQRRWPVRWKAMDWPAEDGLGLSSFDALALEEATDSRQPADDPAATDSDAWQPSQDYRSYSVAGGSEQQQWLRYRHFVPMAEDWRILPERALTDRELAGVRPRLITDFYAYNTGRLRGNVRDQDVLGLHWVGDLALECEVTVESPAVESPAGELVLELVEGGVRFQCRVDLASGEAKLGISGLDGFEPSAQTPMQGPGRYRLRFANVDDQLLLWVNGDVVEFDAATTYDGLDNQRPQPADLSPAGIAVRRAALRVDHLRILRDVYYIADKSGEDNRWPDQSTISEYRYTRSQRLREQRLRGLLPENLAEEDEPRIVAFDLAADQFLVLGDNSPRSKDSRMWDGRDEQGNPEYYVSRDLLIGKALYIYWPHALNHVPWNRDIWFPFFPNVGRMGLVR
jgi:signal peptidase I